MGSIGDALRNHRLLTMLCVGVIIVCAVLLGLKELSRPWTVVLQVASAVSGAALGNFLRLDLSQSVVRNQARPATRHLFDQVGRFRSLVQRAEGFEQVVRQACGDGQSIDQDRIGDWFGSLGMELRDEINATAAAIEHWGDLAPDVRDLELANYDDRERRLPRVENSGTANE